MKQFLKTFGEPNLNKRTQMLASAPERQKSAPGVPRGNTTSRASSPGVNHQTRLLLTQQARTLMAPPVYRPQPTPRVLQTKTRALSASLKLASATSTASTQKTLAVKKADCKPAGVIRHDSGRQKRETLAYSGGRAASVQRFTSRVVQAVKFYPNLHPGAVEPIDASNVFKLDSFANQYRLRKVNSHGVNVPNQQYNFVRTRDGETLLHSRYRHPSIAEGKQVLYAGEIFFNNGQLQWWSNGSGHYQPYVEDAEQAALPMDHFFSYQQIIKGEHTRKRS
jgi:hypothetical protein